MSEKDLFPPREQYEGKTVRDFCRMSLDNFDEIRFNFDYAWFVEGYRQVIWGEEQANCSHDEAFSAFMDYDLVIPNNWDGLPYSIALKTFKEFFHLA